MDRSLADLEVMVLDCQATGPNPAKGRLLEVGWMRTRASGRPGRPESYLARWPDDWALPSRVHKVTGIEKNELTSSFALRPSEIWQRLSAAAREVARQSDREICPTVIHFCRFEIAHLEHIHRSVEPEGDYPFDVICTHEIAKRLLPDLPRRGLRALAGYFGHSVPELRRSVHHVCATAHIWRCLIARLEEAEGVRTEAELRHWLEDTSARLSRGRAYPLEPSIRLGLPDRPGVYRMLRSNGDLLYVGKARSLRRRVNSYFQTRGRHADRTLEMLTQASRLDFTVTPTSLEAAVLESDEIKRASPPYNIALRERDRRMTFFSPNCLETGSAPDDGHPIGPVPSVDGLRFLGLLADSLDGGHERWLADWPAGAGIAPEYAPDQECFLSGFERFQTKYAHGWRRPVGVGSLIRLGIDLWRNRLVSSGTENQDEEEEAEEDWQWTPDRVVSWLENRTLRGAHLIRRARWLCLLSESALAWRTRESDPGKKRMLVFSGGAIVHREALDTDRPLPDPPGLTRALRQRQQGFDLITYDRLSVVTTELRRLLLEGRNIELRLSPKRVLSSEAVARVLQWV